MLKFKDTIDNFKDTIYIAATEFATGIDNLLNTKRKQLDELLAKAVKLPEDSSKIVKLQTDIKEGESGKEEVKELREALLGTRAEKTPPAPKI